ncbi:B-cell differentiation antigen CD72 isoform X2 [Nycticebus coucang]|uniref:B-cell differentiation antigen CD72 isoform X2 n=1 Tax=Nycticebus coucang TaxID=9470 RepID=UPI00234C2DA4|nr:B-cell differentiation antigen CD72 isoform X2 [Nycticebus coucang]
MADTITYADLRFVKAPLKKSVSSRPGQVPGKGSPGCPLGPPHGPFRTSTLVPLFFLSSPDPEADEDGELTYENVQVSPVSGGPSGLASSGLADRAGLESLGVKAEQPAAAWRSLKSPAARRLLLCQAACWQYLLLGLLLTCLLLGVAATCLGVHYLQASQQLQQMNGVLEATNSSLRQQLHLKITRLGQREEELQGSRRELEQSQEALQAQQKAHQAAEGQLQACLSDRERTNGILQSEKAHRSTLEQKMSSMQDALRSFLTCSSPDTCCPVGWIHASQSCFYFSSTLKSWQESKDHCESLSSKLAIFSRNYYYSIPEVIRSHLLDVLKEPHWIDLLVHKEQKWSEDTRFLEVHGQGQKCTKLQKATWSYKRLEVQQEECTTSLPSICERTPFRFSNVH